MVPEPQDHRIVRPFIASAFDVGVVVELNPRGKVSVSSLPLVIFAVTFVE